MCHDKKCKEQYVHGTLPSPPVSQYGDYQLYPQLEQDHYISSPGYVFL